MKAAGRTSNGALHALPSVPWALAIATWIVVLASHQAIAGTAMGRVSASASANVSLTIPKISGFDLQATAAASNVSTRVDLTVFQTGNRAILIRTAPQRTPRSLLTASLRAAIPSSQIIAATGAGWQTLHDTPPAPPASTTSTEQRPDEITYELWQF